MKAKDFLLVVVTLGIVALFYLTFEKQKQAETDRKLDSLMSRHVKIMSIDSIESVITKRILDSVNVITEIHESQLIKLQRDATAIRKENEALQRKFDSIVVDRPDF